MIALAEGEDKEEYERLYSQYDPNAFEDGSKDVSQGLNRLSRQLLPLLMDKVKSGEWMAHAFGYEAGMPTEIHADLWQSLTLHPMLNILMDNSIHLSSKNSRTGRFHTVTFTVVRPETMTRSHAQRAAEVAKVRKYFQKLDAELSMGATKADFFSKARAEFGPDLQDATLKRAWAPPTKLKEGRRKPGSRKSN